MPSNFIPNSQLLTALLEGPFKHYEQVSKDDWRDPAESNAGFSLSHKGYYDHRTGERGSLYELALKKDVLPIVNGCKSNRERGEGFFAEPPLQGAQPKNKNLPQHIWEKSTIAQHTDSPAFKTIKTYLTAQRKIPVEDYADLLKLGLIRVNEYRDEQMLIYPSLSPQAARDAMQKTPYAVHRIQRIFLNADGTKNRKNSTWDRTGMMPHVSRSHR